MRVLKTKVITACLCLALLVLFAGTGWSQESVMEIPSLYDRLGGLPAISVVVSDFLDAMVPDSILNQNPAIEAARKAVPKEYLKYHVTAMVCQATGGPCQYHGRSMNESHAHLNITAAEWKRMEVILTDVLKKHNVPKAEMDELMSIVESTRADIVMSE